MMFSRGHSTLLAVLLGTAVAGGAVRTQPASSEEFAQGQFRLALEFMRKMQYAEALADLQRIVEAYPSSSVADDAMLEIATYYLEIARDIDAAQRTITSLLQKYPATDKTPLAYVMAGRIGMFQGSAPDQIKAVLANFERAGIVPRLDVTPIASFYAGQALRIGDRHGEAVDRLMRVVVEYPRSPWAARSLLELARAWTSLREPRRAMAALQRTRERFPGSPEAASALAWNTLLYRLYIKASKGPAFAFSGSSYVGAAGKLEDVRAVVADGQRVFAVSRQSTLEFGPDGKIVRSYIADDGRGLILLAGRQPIIVSKDGLVSAGATRMLLTVPKSDGSPRRLEDLRAAVPTETGVVLVADGDLRAIVRFAPDGKALGEFAPVQASRLATNELGEIAAIDRENRAIVRFDRVGRPIGRLPWKGTAYELRNPVDLAFDPVGHLYVLDRDPGTVFVFGARETLVATFTLADRVPGAFRRATALGVDETGQLLIHDERAERIQVYR